MHTLLFPSFNSRFCSSESSMLLSCHAVSRLGKRPTAVVDKRLKLDEPFTSDFQYTQPRPIKVMDPVPISTRADEKALENAKTGKMTAAVTVMHMYGNTKTTYVILMPKIVLKRPN
jgi:hypothetical protein